MLCKGTITGLSGHPMSGLWQLLIEPELDDMLAGCPNIVHISSGYGVRQLAEAFGATEGKGDLMEKITGKEIYYSTDAFGVMDGFTPVAEASPELVEAYESQEEEDE